MFVGLFVSVLDEDAKHKVAKIVINYGFKKIQDDLFESYSIREKDLNKLKVDIAPFLSYDDQVRFYQYPIENGFKVTVYKERKWKRLSFKSDH